MLRNSKLLLAVLLLVAAEAMLFNALGRYNILPEGSEHWTEDWLIRYFSKRETEPHKDIALVLVNDETLEKEKLGPSLPVDRAWIAKLVKTIDSAGPKAIALDFYYASPIDPAKDETLAAALRNTKAPAVLAAVDGSFLATDTQRSFLRDFIERTGRSAGHIYIKRSSEALLLGDKASRLIDHGASADGYRSFASEIAHLPAVVEEFGEPAIPDGAQRIDWLLPPPGKNTFQRIPAYQIASPDDAGARGSLKDKIVLVGPDFPHADRHYAPFSVGSQTEFPGVFVQAQALAQILDGRFFYNWTSLAQFLFLFATGLAGAFSAVALQGSRVAILLGIAGTVVIVLASIPLFMARIAIPSALAILVWAGGITIGEWSHKRFRN